MLGFNIGTINFKNAFENAILFSLGALLGSFITFKVLIGTTDVVMDQVTPMVTEAIKKETNKIVNEIKFENNKFKKNDSLNIIIDQKPINDQKPTNVIIKESDTIPKKKKGFFGRLFSKKE